MLALITVLLTTRLVPEPDLRQGFLVYTSNRLQEVVVRVLFGCLVQI